MFTFGELCTSIKGLLPLSFVIIEFCIVLYVHALVLDYVVCTRVVIGILMYYLHLCNLRSFCCIKVLVHDYV